MSPDLSLQGPLPRAEERGEGDLDERIDEAERRLIEREERLRRDVKGLGLRVMRPLESCSRAAGRAVPIVAAVLAASGLWWLVRRPKPRRVAASDAPPTPPAPGAGSALLAGLAGFVAKHRPTDETAWWLPLIALAWPLLPATWRSRISPATASALVALGIPLVQRLGEARRELHLRYGRNASSRAPPPAAPASASSRADDPRR